MVYVLLGGASSVMIIDVINGHGNTSSNPRPPPHNECPVYGIKQSDSDVPVMLKLWGMQSTPSLPSLPVSLWPGVVAPDRILSIGQIGGARGLMVIVVGNGHGDTSSNPGRD